MINFQEKFLNILYAGIFLLSACIIGTCISYTSKPTVSIISMQYNVLLFPNIISYALIIIGVLGYLNIFNLINSKRKS